MNKKYLICHNLSVENSVIEKVSNALKKNGANFEITDIDNLKSGFDFVFVIGGDGTILKAARFFAKFQTPIFGINLGHLGFLSQTNLEDFEHALNSILNNNYKVEKRIMLECNNYLAFNEFVVKSSESSRILSFAIEIDGKFMCEYSADGVIISTPTGSTAYSMAAGGTVLTPNLDVLEIVPICPHSFSSRPIVIPSDSKIKIITKSDRKYILSSDGQCVFEFDKDIIISKSSFCANLALLNENDFYSVLRNKLQWGIAPINKQ